MHAKIFTLKLLADSESKDKDKNNALIEGRMIYY